MMKRFLMVAALAVLAAVVLAPPTATTHPNLNHGKSPTDSARGPGTYSPGGRTTVAASHDAHLSAKAEALANPKAEATVSHPDHKSVPFTRIGEYCEFADGGGSI